MSVEKGGNNESSVLAKSGRGFFWVAANFYLLFLSKLDHVFNIQNTGALLLPQQTVVFEGVGNPFHLKIVVTVPAQGRGERRVTSEGLSLEADKGRGAGETLTYCAATLRLHKAVFIALLDAMRTCGVVKSGEEKESRQ